MSDSDATLAESVAADVQPVDDRAVRRVGAVFLGGLAVVTLALALVAVIRGPQGQWRGALFSGVAFEGDPVFQYSSSLDFDWKLDAPAPGVPADNWSAIFTTCLTIDESLTTRFRLTSDDGSMLFVDRERVIDNGGEHSARVRTSRSLTLEPGTYQLTVEYVDYSASAMLKLAGALGEGMPFVSIPPEMLKQPSHDPDAPCG